MENMAHKLQPLRHHATVCIDHHPSNENITINAEIQKIKRKIQQTTQKLVKWKTRLRMIETMKQADRQSGHLMIYAAQNTLKQEGEINSEVFLKENQNDTKKELAQTAYSTEYAVSEDNEVWVQSDVNAFNKGDESICRCLGERSIKDLTDSGLGSSADESDSSGYSNDISDTSDSEEDIEKEDVKISHSFHKHSGLDTKYRKTNSACGLVTCLELVSHPEGGYFREMYRSGSTPMSTKGQTDVNVATRFGSRHLLQLANQMQVGSDRKIQYESLTIAPGREDRRSDCDIRRNCLTTIIWMPTALTPRLFLSINLSDHVHFYHGGAGFEYLLYDPDKRELRRELLGGNTAEGQKLQVACPGGVWKCGRLLKNDTLDYCLIGEAVAPGFDFHDFSWVTKSEIMSLPNKEHQHILLQFLHDGIENLSGKEVEDAIRYYDKEL